MITTRAFIAGACCLLFCRLALAEPCRAKFDCHHKHLRNAPLQQGVLPRPGQRRAGRFLSARGLPTGPRARAGRGDYYVRSHRLLATVRAADGALVDLALGPKFVDRFGWGKVRVCDSEGTHAFHVRRFVIRGEELVVVGEAAGSYTVETRYRITPGHSALKISTWLTNTSSRARRQVRVCDNLGLSSTPLFISGHGVRSAVSYERRVHSPFGIRSEPTRTGRTSFLLAPLASPSIGFRLVKAARSYDPPLPIDADYRWQRIQSRQKVLAARRMLVVQEGPAFQVLAEALAARQASTQTLRVAHRLVVEGTTLIVERNNSPYLQTLLFDRQTKPGPQQREVSLKLPVDGRYRLKMRLPGVGDGPPLTLTRRSMKLVAVPALPPMGRVRFEIRAKRRPPQVGHASLLPAKLVFAAERGTTPPDFGRRGDQRVDNVIYTHGEGEVWLAPGRYRVQISSGPRRELVYARLVVAKDKTIRLQRSLRRLITTPGWISADLHTHSNASIDSALSATTRLVSAAATATEMIVATDHNAVTDYGAGSRAGQLLGKHLPITICGQEVTTWGHAFGHFNVFPLTANNPLPWRYTSPFALFSAVRRHKPLPLLQVNHPLMRRIGYFDLMGLDLATGKARARGYRDDFDLLEVANGDLIDDWSRLMSNFRAWFALLNQGRRYVATGNSDAHILPVQEVGYPRNYILWQRPSAPKPAATTESVLAALRAGRSFVSTGPVVNFSIDGQPLGSRVIAKSKTLPVQLTVQAAPWVKLDHLVLYANGVPLRRWRLRRASRATKRFSHSWKLTPPARDTWYVVLVHGRAADPTQQRSVLPFALTNPIWIDVDGDGRYAPLKARQGRKTP